MLKATLAAGLLLNAVASGQVDSARQYRIDTNHSTVGCSVSIMGGLSKVNGKFKDFTVRKLSETRSYDHGWEADMCTLDLLSNALHDEPNSTGYIFVYGAKRGHRNDVARRVACIKSYMLQRRGTAADSLKVVNGGCRERAMIELWIVPDSSSAPVPSPTVGRRDVRFKRGGTKYTCSV
jgi:hypothetical protein